MPRRLPGSWLPAALVLVAVLAGDALAAPPPAAPTRSRLVAAAVPYVDGQVLDVYAPAGAALPGRPVVVMVPSCCGDRADLGKLAEAVAAAGAVVLVADWAGLSPGATRARSYGQVACAVSFARARGAAYGGDTGRVVLLGWSDGAQAAAVVALTRPGTSSPGCRGGAASPVPDAVLGVAGFYGWQLPVDPRYVSDRAVAFVGGTPQDAPGAWRSATPYGLLDGPSATCFVLVVGTTDPLLAGAQALTAALRRTGHRADLVVAPYAGDQTMISPRTQEGRTTVAAALAATPCPPPPA